MKKAGLLLAVAIALGCGGATSSLLNPLKPAITSLTQSSATTGGGDFLLGVRGTSFIPGCKVLFNGQERDTAQLDPGELNATILAADIANSGTYPVVVQNPDGTESDPVNFTVHP
jgi:hypothetical protein